MTSRRIAGQARDRGIVAICRFGEGSVPVPVYAHLQYKDNRLFLFAGTMTCFQPVKVKSNRTVLTP